LLSNYLKYDTETPYNSQVLDTGSSHTLI